MFCWWAEIGDRMSCSAVTKNWGRCRLGEGRNKGVLGKGLCVGKGNWNGQERLEKLERYLCYGPGVD